MKVKSILLAIVSMTFISTSFAEEVLRISLDTNPTHLRNKSVQIFVDELKKRTGDYFDIKVFPSAQLYRDRDVIRAIRQNEVEMAFPVPQHFEGTVPNAAISGLPMFYGIDSNQFRKSMGGKVADVLTREFEEKLQVVIPGKFLDIGMQQIWTTKKEIKTVNDLKNLRIRYHGGFLNSSRLSEFESVPVLIPFSDLPMALSQGTVDGLYTTTQSAVSSKLYDLGIKYGFKDNSQYYQYVPMIGKSFWDKQPSNIQQAIKESWEIAVIWNHDTVDRTQREAALELEKRGIIIITPTDESLTKGRKILMKQQSEFVKKLKIDQELVNMIMINLKQLGVKY